MSDLSIHVPNIVEEIRVCQGTLPGVGEKAYMCEMVEQHTDHLVPSTSAMKISKKGQL